MCLLSLRFLKHQTSCLTRPPVSSSLTVQESSLILFRYSLSLPQPFPQCTLRMQPLPDGWLMACPLITTQCYSLKTHFLHDELFSTNIYTYSFLVPFQPSTTVLTAKQLAKDPTASGTPWSALAMLPSLVSLPCPQPWLAFIHHEM